MTGMWVGFPDWDEKAIRADERRATVDWIREQLASNHNTLGAEFYRLDQIEAILDEAAS